MSEATVRRLLDLAEQVRRLPPPGRRDPERFWRDRDELAAELRRIAREAEPARHIVRAVG